MENPESPNNKYKIGNIYKITDISHTEQYIGSTVQPLSSRTGSHRKIQRIRNGMFAYMPVFDLFDKYSLEHCKIELIEHYPCKDNEELRKREGYWIKQADCVNKQITGRTGKEYREDNKDRIAEAKQGHTDGNIKKT